MNLENLVKKYRELFKSSPVVATAHDDKSHWYISPVTKEKYHSVTYYTAFIKDPSLSEWKKNRALESITEKWRPNQGYSQELINAIIVEAKAKPQMEFEGAGDIGTQVHAWRQKMFQDWIDSEEIETENDWFDDYPLPTGADPEVISGCRAIKQFLKDTGAIPAACELPLVDDELKVGGQIDDLMVFPNMTKVLNDAETCKEREIGGYKTTYKPYLAFVDLKTSNIAKKPAYFMQIRGFYQKMIWKTFHIKPKKTYILSTSKLNGTYDLIDITDMGFLQRDAKLLVKLSRSWDKMMEYSKPKVITI